jgi:membrane fusion protein (multidrug efflux system)
MKKIIIFSLSALLLSACGSQPKDKNAELAKLKKEQADLNSKIVKLETEIGGNQEKVYKDVSVYDVKASTFKTYIEIQGKVDAEQNVQVNAQAPGVITNIFVGIGQHVNKGQVLAQLDDAVLRENIAQVQTQLDLATNLFNRQKNLWDQKIGTEVQFLNAKTQKQGLEKQMALVKEQASMYKVKSPIEGTIDLMDWKIGQAVQPGISGIRVVNASVLKAKALVSESYAGKIDIGDNVDVIVPDAPDSIATKISFASKIIDPASRSFTVEVKLPSKKIYRPNMLAILKIVDYKKDNALTVPIRAIQKSEIGDYLLLAQDGKVVKANVKVGNIYNGNAEILSGIKSGDKVITLGYNGLNEGDLVKF